MLNRLYVKNVALIPEADIEFDDGLNVLSGETGSGKSVILDSINFVLGSKADRTMIRYGEKEAFVRAEFTINSNSEAALKLQEYDIECDDTVIITRRINTEGKSTIKINGNSVTAAMLKNISQHLVDVHGQSEHFFLLSESNQLKVVDSLLGKKAEQLKSELSILISEKKQLKNKISALGGNESERAHKLDLLSFQINEIESAELKTGESEELRTKQSLIINAEKILTCLNNAKSALTDDGGSCDGVSSAVHSLNQISGLNSEYSNISERLESVYTELTDISETIADMAENVFFDEREAQFVDERLSLIKILIKKYGPDEEAILKFLDEAKAEYDAISDSAATIEKYDKQIRIYDDKIFTLCKELTKLRKETAVKFSGQVEEQLRTLNIINAKFNVAFNEYDRKSVNLLSANGSDEVRFEFSANKGEPLKPLSKVISGGEMSRFMLAVKTQLKDLNGISTYIFDEIDAGISGITAGKVAEKFIDIAKNTQILAVSHLPQVCAASDAQYLIYKVEEVGKTLTKVKRLSQEEKVDEIVRLTGSVYSQTAKKHAEELISKIRHN